MLFSSIVQRLYRIYSNKTNWKGKGNVLRKKDRSEENEAREEKKWWKPIPKNEIIFKSKLFTTWYHWVKNCFHSLFSGSFSLIFLNILHYYHHCCLVSSFKLAQNAHTLDRYYSNRVQSFLNAFCCRSQLSFFSWWKEREREREKPKRLRMWQKETIE